MKRLNLSSSSTVGKCFAKNQNGVIGNSSWTTKLLVRVMQVPHLKMQFMFNQRQGILQIAAQGQKAEIVRRRREIEELQMLGPLLLQLRCCNV
jgi:hypothetical protein